MKSSLVNIDTQKLNLMIKKEDLKQWWVAEFGGVHVSTLRRWQKGKIKKAQRTKLKSIAELIGCETLEKK